MEKLITLTNLEYVLSGEFLHDRKKDANKQLTDKIHLKLKSLYPDMIEEIKIKSYDTNLFFKDLLKYRQSIYKITSPYSGIMEGFSSGAAL